MAVTLIILVCLILAGAMLPKPVGWVIVGLAVVALLLVLVPGLPGSR
jgi:hypothetical protein